MYTRSRLGGPHHGLTALRLASPAPVIKQ